MALSFLIPLIFFVVFPLFWMGIVGLIGKAAWGPLARVYPAEEWPARGFKLSMQSGRIGMSSYSGAINAVATPEGLYLRPTLFFRVGHPPVFIPWDAFVDRQPAMLWGTRYILADGPNLTFQGKLAKAISAAIDAHHEASGAEQPEDEWGGGEWTVHDDGPIMDASGETESGDSPWEAAAEESEPGRSRREGRRRV